MAPANTTLSTQIGNTMRQPTHALGQHLRFQQGCCGPGEVPNPESRKMGQPPAPPGEGFMSRLVPFHGFSATTPFRTAHKVSLGEHAHQWPTCGRKKMGWGSNWWVGPAAGANAAGRLEAAGSTSTSRQWPPPKLRFHFTWATCNKGGWGFLLQCRPKCMKYIGALEKIFSTPSKFQPLYHAGQRRLKRRPPSNPPRVLDQGAIPTHPLNSPAKLPSGRASSFSAAACAFADWLALRCVARALRDVGGTVCVFGSS